MGNLVSIVLVSILAACALAAPASADKRVALVIGNSSYRHVPKLLNPANDANAMSGLLRSVGFDVIETRRDLGISEMRRAIRDFSNVVHGAEMAVVFYAGHGIEVDGNNYLIPIDAELVRDVDVEDETISLERVLKVLEPARRLRLIMLDACRDNPFAKTMRRTMASRAVSRGLAKVDPVLTDTLIAFAAKAGSTSADGSGPQSPFTAALLAHLGAPGVDLRIVLGRVRDEVLKSTRNKQEPFVYGSLGGADVTLVSLSTEQSAGRTPSGDGTTNQAQRDYELAVQISTKEIWDSFLEKHPTGFYADLARAQRAKLSNVRVPSPQGARTEMVDADTRNRITRFIEFEDLVLGEDDHYAPQVDYFNKGVVGRETILQDIAAHRRIWPIQTYHLTPGTLNITPLGGGRFSATFSLTFTKSNGRKKVNGHARKQLELMLEGDRVYITKVKEIVQRQ